MREYKLPNAQIQNREQREKADVADCSCHWVSGYPPRISVLCATTFQTLLSRSASEVRKGYFMMGWHGSTALNVITCSK